MEQMAVTRGAIKRKYVVMIHAGHAEIQQLVQAQAHASGTLTHTVQMVVGAIGHLHVIMIAEHALLQVIA